MAQTCGKCGGTLEAGFTTAIGLISGARIESQESQLVFVVPGSRTSMNPLRAFQQGLTDEPSNRPFRISGFRCSNCGALDLYANEAVTV